MNKFVKLFTDGGARGNPGPAAIGAVASMNEGEELFRISEYIGDTTNNIAEYRALEAALTSLIGNKYTGEVQANLDSELVVKQINGEYRIKNASLLPIFNNIKQLSRNFEKITFQHVRREQNKIADMLVNKALDERK